MVSLWNVLINNLCTYNFFNISFYRYAIDSVSTFLTITTYYSKMEDSEKSNAFVLEMVRKILSLNKVVVIRVVKNYHFPTCWQLAITYIEVSRCKLLLILLKQ